MTPRLNVLWIMADQMRGDCAGYMGHPLVQTPYLDQLARESVVFERAFAQSPLCGPSRTCLFTGRYVHEHGVWWNGVPYRFAYPTLPEILRSSGYQTAVVGKLHFAPPGRHFGFDFKELHEECLLDGTGLEAYDRFLEEQDPPAKGAQESTEWLNRISGLGVCEMDESQEGTRWVADSSCDFLRSRAREPFFLFSSFVRPHSPYNPLRSYAEAYAKADVPAPAFSKDEWDRLPPRVRATAKSWGWDALSAGDFAEVRRHYYGLCTQVDANVGRILSCLDELSLSDSTIVVFTSDHGDFLGEHGLLYKEHLYDGSLRVPLLVRDPGRPGSRYSGLVESIDIMPTVLEMTGSEVPHGLSGTSLAGCFDGGRSTHRAAVFSEWRTHCVNPRADLVHQACVHPNIYSVRTPEWRYTYYVDEPGELYDTKSDPGERWNLIEEAAHGDVVRRLQTKILVWIAQTEYVPDSGEDNPYFDRSLSATE